MRRFSAPAAVAVCLLIAACGGPSQTATGSRHPSDWGATPAGFVAPRTLLGVQRTQTMYDAVTVANIPAHPLAAAGYTAGNWPTWPSIRALARHAVSIAIQARFHADCLDVEPGDAQPSQAGPWARADIAAGFAKPCLYSDLSEMPQVKASLSDTFGASWRSKVMLWLAWYRGTPGLVAGYDAVQYSDKCLGRNLDCSTVSLAFLSIAQPPYKPPAPLAVCYHRREHASVCSAAKAKVASDQRAAAASLAVFQARGCPALEARAQWFAARLRHHPQVRRIYRRDALRATRTTIRQADCRLFSQRASYFTSRATAIQAAN